MFSRSRTLTSPSSRRSVAYGGSEVIVMVVTAVSSRIERNPGERFRTCSESDLPGGHPPQRQWHPTSGFYRGPPDRPKSSEIVDAVRLAARARLWHLQNRDRDRGPGRTGNAGDDTGGKDPVH